MKSIKTNDFYPNENILPDNYPIYYGYLYLCDSIIVSSDICGEVIDLKRDTGCNEVRNCDFIERKLF